MARGNCESEMNKADHQPKYMLYCHQNVQVNTAIYSCAIESRPVIEQSLRPITTPEWYSQEARS